MKAILESKSRLCVGLDPENVPSVFEFNKKIIDETHDLVCAYKPNLAFYKTPDLLRTIEYIHEKTKVPVILDAKYGDIGNTAKQYAKIAFEFFKADAVTVNPYMGYDTIKPFADYKDKGVFILCLTSNPSSADFENDVYLKVAKKIVEWNVNGNLGLVVGATKPEQLKEIEKITGDLPILIPGIGAQGGGIPAMKRNYIINVSRAIIFAENPRQAAMDYTSRM